MRIYKIFILLLFNFNLKGQLGVYLIPYSGIHASYSKILANKGKPSPYIYATPYFNNSVFAIGLIVRYKKWGVEIDYENTLIGSEVTDETEYYYCKNCEFPSSRELGYAVPMTYFPIKISYLLFDNNNFELSSKIGFFRAKRNGGFMNENLFGNYYRKELILRQPNGIPFTYTSNNIEGGLELTWKFGKKRKSAITINALYNYGLKVLGEDTYIFERPNNPSESFETHITRRGSFSGLQFGYRFQILNK